MVLRLRAANFVNSDVVPKAVAGAACEMARELLIADRTASPVGEGVDRTATGMGTTTATSIRYSKADTRPIISHLARAMLSKYGGLINGGGGAVRLARV